MECWQRRDLTAKRYVYFWVDGIYFGARMEEEKQCILVTFYGHCHVNASDYLYSIYDGPRRCAK
jgi:hypothetical protein